MRSVFKRSSAIELLCTLLDLETELLAEFEKASTSDERVAAVRQLIADTARLLDQCLAADKGKA